MQSQSSTLVPSTASATTGNIYIDSILWEGNRLPNNTITYSFWNNASVDDSTPNNIAQLDIPWWETEKTSVTQALTTWSDVANIEFIQTSDNDTEADFKLVLTDNIDLDNALGMFFPPGESGAGIGYFNFEGAGWDTVGLAQGGFGFVTLIHELGHGLGLAHPHDNGGNSPLYPGVLSAEDLGDNNLNQGIWTTMSYNDGWESRNGELFFTQNLTDYGYQGTPMAFDIAAIQFLYGANLNHQAGDNVYSLPKFNGAGAYYSSIWDTGGIDTIDTGLTSTNAVINLNAGPLVGPNAGGFVSYIDGVYGGFTIANGVVIENAVGGDGDDLIIGNEVANSLVGNNGDDVLDGLEGDDVLDGSFGNDVLYGFSGDDLLQGGHGDDRLYGEAGNDVLEGFSGNDSLDGGSGDDVLAGGLGHDILWGGDGNDLLRGDLNRADLQAEVLGGNDIIFGGAGDDRIGGKTGDDQLFGDGGNDEIWGGLGNDTLWGGADNDVLHGCSGDDVLIGGQGQDVLVGGMGNDRLQGSNGLDQSIDLLEGGAGSDTFVLGNGHNYQDHSYQGDSYGLILDWEADFDTIEVFGNLDQYSFLFDNVLGSSAQDTVIQFNDGAQTNVIGIIQDSVEISAANFSVLAYT